MGAKQRRKQYLSKNMDADRTNGSCLDRQSSEKKAIPNFLCKIADKKEVKVRGIGIRIIFCSEGYDRGAEIPRKPFPVRVLLPTKRQFYKESPEEPKKKSLLDRMRQLFCFAPTK